MKKREDKFFVFKRLIKQTYKLPHTESIYFDPKTDVKQRVLLWINQKF